MLNPVNHVNHVYIYVHIICIYIYILYIHIYTYYIYTHIHILYIYIHTYIYIYMLNNLNSCILTPSFSSDRETTSPSLIPGLHPFPCSRTSFRAQFFWRFIWPENNLNIILDLLFTFIYGIFVLKNHIKHLWIMFWMVYDV